MFTYFINPDKSEQLIFAELLEICEFIRAKKIKSFRVEWFAKG